MSDSCDPMDCRLQASSVHGILQVRILEWVAISFSMGSSQPRNWTWVSCPAGRCFTDWAMSDAYKNLPTYIFLFWRIRFLILWFKNWLSNIFFPLGITREVCGKEMYYIIFIVIFFPNYSVRHRILQNHEVSYDNGMYPRT